MRLQSLLVQLSETPQIFLAVKRQNLKKKKKSYCWKTTHPLSRFEEDLNIIVTWQQPPGHHFKNDKDYCCSSVNNREVANLSEQRVYTCTTKAWLGLQGVGEIEMLSKVTAYKPQIWFFPLVFTLTFHSVFFSM